MSEMKGDSLHMEEGGARLGTRGGTGKPDTREEAHRGADKRRGRQRSKQKKGDARHTSVVAKTTSACNARRVPAAGKVAK